MRIFVILCTLLFPLFASAGVYEDMEEAFLRNTASDDHGAQCGNERRDAGFGDQQPVDHPDQRPTGERDEYRHDDRHFRQRRKQNLH